MATSKLMLDKDIHYRKEVEPEKDQSFPLVLRISHRSKKKYIQTGYHVKEDEWDAGTGRVTKTFQNSGRVNAKIATMLAISLDIVSLPKDVLRNMNVLQVAELVQTKINEAFEVVIPKPVLEEITGTTLEAYSKKVVERYRKAKRHGMADSFEQAVDALVRFNGGVDIAMSRITETFLEDLEADWLGRGNKLGGLGVHLRAIRRICNLAIKDEDTELTTDNYHFGSHGYSIKKGKSKKRAISLDYIQVLRDFDYEVGSPLWHHRNYFLFSFNLRGMNFADLAFLTLENLEDDRLVYERKKTRRGDNVKTFNIKLTNEAKSILSIYTKGKKRNDLIFPILTDVINCGDDRRIHEVKKMKLANHNRRLTKIAKDIGLEGKLTTYVARHTFATAGLYKGVSKTQIGEMMGHTSAVTTEAYFDEFDKEVLDDAADVIFQ